MRRSLRPLALEQLRTLSTARLLAYRDRLLELEGSVEESDSQGDSKLAAFDPARIFFKSDPRWQPLYQALKLELDRREHVRR